MKLPLYYVKVTKDGGWHYVSLCDRSNKTILQSTPYIAARQSYDEALEAARDLMKIFEPGLVELKEE